MTFLRYSFFLFLFVVAPVVQAQQAILLGFVTDAASEQPLQGATVALRQADRLIQGTATDGDGFLVLNRVVPGSYDLEISFIGYTTHRERVNLDAGAVREVRVHLTVRTADMEEMVVTAEAEGGITTVAAGLETVVPAAIKRVPVPGVSGDLASYLQTVPGVTVQGDRGGQFFVRGGAVDQNLALLDGIPVYQPFHVLSFYSAFPEDLVDRAAFYTGGFGARYGGRTSSILDVTARNGNKQNLAGSVALAPFLSSVTIEGPLVEGRVSAILSVRQSFVEDLMPDLFGQRMPYRFGDRFGKVHALLGGSHELSFTFLDTDDQGDIAGSRKSVFGDAQASALSDSTEVAWENRVYAANWIYRSNRLPIVLRLTGGRSEMGNTFGPEGNPERTASVESSEASLRLEWLLRAGHLAIGSTYRRTDMGFVLDDLFTEYKSTDDQLDELLSYVEASIDMADNRLRVNPGLQLYQLPDRSRSWVDPRLRLTLWPDGQEGRFQVNAAWGLYHQAVTGLTDERDLGNLFTAWIVTPDDRPVMQSMHGILGGNMQVRPWLSAAVEGFYKSYDHISAPIFSPFPRFTTTLQDASGSAYGADVRVNLENRPFWAESVLDGTLSYTWSTVEYEAGPYTYNPAHDRRHQFNALMHAQKGDVGLTLQWQYGSGLPFTESGGFDVWYLLTPDVDVATEPGLDRIVYAEPFGGRQPTYSRFDLWIERRVDRGRTIATLRAGVLNLLNRKNLFYYDLFTFSRVDQLPLVPSVGFKLELR